MNKKILTTLIVIFLIFSGTTMFMTYIEIVGADSFDGNYYGYGDSIMKATQCDLAGDGSECYVLYMQETYDALNTSSHNMDGGSKTTNWGKANFASHVSDWGWYIIEAFGVNDIYYNDGNDDDGYYCNATNASQNKLDMYRWSVENNSENHYIPTILTLANDEVNRPLAVQLNHMNVTTSLFKNYSVPYVKLFDAVDSEPYNGRVDDWDGDYYCDTVHLNLLGHKAMGSFLWYFVNGSDYVETYHESNGTITIQADYNETIYVFPRYNWNIENVIVVCVTNSTVINFVEGVDINGNETIQFDILKGSSYEVNFGMQFISIDGGTNGTTVYSSTPTFNWTIISGAVMYNLQIANDSAFTDLVVNLSDINEYDYPSEYDSNETRVSFTLPVANSLQIIDKTYYCRVRAYT